MNNTNAANQVSVGTYGSIAKMTEAAALKGNFSRVLKCGKTYTAAGLDKREIRARLKAVLGDELTGLKVTYTEAETVSRGRKTGKTHIVGTVSLAERKAAETVTVAETHDADPDGTKAQLYAETVANRSLRAENAELRAENEALKARLAEMAAALEMLSAHAVK